MIQRSTRLLLFPNTIAGRSMSGVKLGTLRQSAGLALGHTVREAAFRYLS